LPKPYCQSLIAKALLPKPYCQSLIAKALLPKPFKIEYPNRNNITISGAMPIQNESQPVGYSERMVPDL
jgi:hypothetical protein